MRSLTYLENGANDDADDGAGGAIGANGITVNVVN